MSQRIVLVGSLLLVISPLLASDPEVVRIGVGDARANDFSAVQRKFFDFEFSRMVKEFTGFENTVQLDADVIAGGKKLANGQWHFGIFQGVQFASARSRDPKLQPLMLAIYRHRDIHAQLVVRQDSGLRSATECGGKNLYVFARDHCQLFTDKLAAGKARTFFGKTLSTTNVEAALDSVLRGDVDAAVVDNAGMEIYRDVHPGRFDRLKVLAESERFPAMVVAYREGVLSERMLAHFRESMLQANQTDRGREAMATFQISRFEPVPPDFAETLVSILKAYPAPQE